MPLTLPPLLASLRLPDDVPNLSLPEKSMLAEELRDVIVAVVAQNGGHLASSLGVVELTIALLSVFNPARDAIVWDVGHQSYPWKLLTGRASLFHTLRQKNGLSGFPNRKESPYDVFGAGHASTSLSAALGMAVARDLQGGTEHVVAVIGDGAFGGGMALEAFNHAGSLDKPLIVVFNDNAMSISQTVGALSLFLSQTLLGGRAMRIKTSVARMLRGIPWLGPRFGLRLVNTLRRGEASFKSFFTPGMLFEAFRFNYIGPVDGHNIAQLTQSLDTAKGLNMPVVLHVRTHKGQGYAPAEKSPSRFHGVPPLPSPPSDEYNGPGFSSVLGSTLVALAENDPRVVVITAAMPDGTGTSVFRQRFPDRFIDVGICEEHAVTFAAGLAARGFRPVVAVYSTFLQRAYDQIIHDVCLQNLPVLFCLDRAGLVGEDGPTHHGAFDLSWLRAVPGLSLLAPRDEWELRNALFTAFVLDGPTAIRYPRGNSHMPKATGTPGFPPFARLPFCRGEFLVQGNENVGVLSAGHCSPVCAEAAHLVRARTGKLVSVFDTRWIKPLPAEQILDLAQNSRALVMVEENSLAGGFSSAVLELLTDQYTGSLPAIRRVGLPDRFIPHGSTAALRTDLNLDVAGIAHAIEEACRT